MAPISRAGAVALGCCVFAVGAFGPVPFLHAGDGLISARVTAISPQRPVLVIDRGLAHGVTVGDRLVCLRELRLLAAGEVIRAVESSAAVRCDVLDRGEVEVGRDATVVPSGLAASARGLLGDAVHGVARVDSVLPGQDRVWLDAGSRGGWLAGDGVLLRRGETIFAWGSVVESGADVALVRLDLRRRLVLSARRGDAVEQIGSRRPGGAGRTRVAAVEPVEDGAMLVLAGGPELGLAVDRGCDLFREGAYVGFARVTEVEPVVRAEALAAQQRVPPGPGDVAVVRPPLVVGGPRIGHVFRLEADYVLVTLGEADGVELEQVLVAPRADGTDVRLRVRAVYPQHCGAEVVEPPASGAAPLARGDEVRTPGPVEETRVGLRRALRVEARSSPEWLYEVTLSGKSGSADSAYGEWVALPEGRVGVIVGGGPQRGFAVRIEGVRH